MTSAQESPRSRWRSKSSGVALLLVLSGLVGCGSDGADAGDDDDSSAGGSDGGGSNEPRKPDTGYGKGEAAPNPRTCEDFCARFGDCVVELCSEDDQTRYDELEGLLAASCLSACNDALTSAFESSEWQCYFQSSCREVFDYDECKINGYYYCN
jgi:hypothetical protein